MSLQAISDSVRRTVERSGQMLGRASPTAITAALTAAAVLPLALGQIPIDSPFVIGALGLVGGIGQNILAGLLQDYAARLRAKGPRPAPEDDIHSLLQRDLQAKLEAGDSAASQLRSEISQWLQATHTVETALAAAPGEIRQAVAQGLAEMGGSFQEFHWILDEVRTTLEDIRMRQSLQLAMQQEQLHLQRQQAQQLNTLVQRQQGQAGVSEGQAVPVLAGGRRSARGWLIGAAAAIMVLGAGLWLLFTAAGGSLLASLRPPPARMTGEFNIAIAEFESAEEGGSVPAPGTGLAVARQVYARLTSDLNQGQDAAGGVVYQLLPPEQAGKVAGKTAADRAQAAAALAELVGADIVVYGTVSGDADRLLITPAFYVSERVFIQIPEFIGEHPLGGSIALESGGDLAGTMQTN